MTIELWVKGNSTNSNPDWRAIVAKGNNSWRLQGVYRSQTADFATTGLGNTDLEGSRNINDGQWHHLAGVYDGTSKYLYVDGTLDISAVTSGSIAITTASVGIGENSESINGYYFNGLIDEVSLYNRALSSNEIYAIYAAGTNGKCPPLPVITVQPVGELAMPGCSFGFTVAATGSSPLGYQWYQNSLALGGQTNSSLLLANIQSTNFGSYWVVITSSAGAAVTSSTAVLALDHAPVAGPSTIQRFLSGGAKAPVSALLANATDADGDPLSITSVSPNSAANGTVVLSGNYIYYTPPAGYTNSDLFSYTLSDGHCGGTSVGYATVQVQTNTSVPGSLAIQAGTGGSIVLNLSGVPGESYRIQSTASLTPPAWTDIGTNLADFFGGILFTNPLSPANPARYYRAVTP